MPCIFVLRAYWKVRGDRDHPSNLGMVCVKGSTVTESIDIPNGARLQVRSRRGSARFPVAITKAITPDTVFVPMHWGTLWADQAEANTLTHPESCPDSLQPELKACAVQLVPIAAEDVSSEYLLQPTQAEVSLPVSV